MHRFLYNSGRALAWLALVMTLPFAAARAQTFLAAPLNISGTGQAVTPSIAAGPNGEIDVVWLDSNAILFRRTLDAGKTFSPTMKVATTDLPSQASQPQIAVNTAGVYVAWAGTNGSGGGDIFVSALANGSNSGFSAPVNVSVGRGIASGSAPVPHVAAEPSGAVDIVWGQTAGFFARSTNGGNTFVLTQLTPLSGSPMQRVSPRIAIGAQEHIYVAWVVADPNFPNCSGPTIKFARSTNGGTAFGVYSVADNLTVGTQRISGCTSDVQIAVGTNNTIHLLWANENPGIQDLITTYAADQEPFSADSTFPETAFQNLSTTASHTPEMAIDSSGNINVVWTGDVSNNDTRQLIYFSRSDNTSTQPAGEKFTNPQALTAASASGAKATGFPQIAVEPSGPIDLLWQQASVANPSNAYDIVLARSTIGGAAFQQFTLDNSPTITGDTGELAVDTSGNVYAMWLGNSGSSADVMLNGDSKALPDPGFSLTISTSSQTVLPGSALSFNITVSSAMGSAQNVGLSCSSAPAGAQCSFNPGTVTVSSGSATSTLTLTLPQTIGAGTYSVTVMGAGGGFVQTVSTTLVVGGLTASVSPASATINVGGSASFTVSLTSTGFSGSITLGCSAPSGISCGFNPGSVSLASGAASSTLNVSVTAKPAAAAPHHPGRDFGWRPQDDPAIAVWIWSIGLLALLAIVIASRKNASGLPVPMANRNKLGYKALALARAVALSLLLAAVAMGITSCGGSASNGGGGGGGSNTFPLIVQAKTSSGTTNLQTISITVP